MGSCYRAIRTTPERRVGNRRCFLIIDEYRVKLRPSRNWIRLPNSYCDVHRRDWEDRTWKRHRMTQYKPKEWHDGLRQDS